MVERHLREAADSLSLLRIRILRKDPKNKDLRSSFREISHHLENAAQMNPVAREEYQRLAAWLSMFLEAEFGAKLRRFRELEGGEQEALIAHINARKQLMLQSEQSIPELRAAVNKCMSILNHASRHPNELDKQARELARALENHMLDDEKLRKALNDLIAALQKSMEEIGAMLADVGEDSPELDAARNLLDQDLPEDPKAAKEVLLKAREGILATGERVSAAGKGIRRMMAEHQSQLEHLSESLNAAEFAARHDPLTGLGNRRMLASFVQKLGDKSAAFLLLDIDHFKRINDLYGHDAGDEILTRLARTLSQGVRSSDLAVRMGGEEFAVVLPETDADNAFRIAETLRQAASVKGVRYRNREINYTVSIGLSVRKGAESLAQWFKRADEALYRAKDAGRNQTVTAKN